MISLPLTRLKIENNNERLLQLKRKSNAEVIANSYASLIKYHQGHLEIAKEVGSKAGEGGRNGNLGNAYRRLRKFNTAIEYHQRHLEIAREVGD